MSLLKRSLLLVAVGLCLCGLTLAETQEELNYTESPPYAPGSDPITQDVGQIAGLLFVGTSTNTNSPGGTANDVFTVDPGTDVSTSILSGVGVWGATADLANSRVLFTRASGLTPPSGQIGGGDELFEVPFAGDTPTSLGRITNAAGDGQRIDGLAVSGGVLYGSYAGGTGNGLYEIDWGTLIATQVASWSDSISGIDADPATGTIWGVNDSTGQLVTITTGGTITNVAAYPSGYSDIDGIAVGNGFAYLVTDEAGGIPVYDIAGGDYTISLTSPFSSADTFSGAALAGGDGGGDGGDGGAVPATNTWGLITLIALIMVASLFYLRRRARA